MKKASNVFGYCLLLLVFILIVLVPSCEMKYCFVEHSTDNSIEAEYRYYDGTEDKLFYLDEGDKIEISYESTEEKGKLSTYMKSPTGKIIAEIDGGTIGTETIVADEKGRYRLIIKGKKTAGEYSLSWDVKE